MDKPNVWKKFETTAEARQQYEERRKQDNEVALTLLNANSIGFLITRNPYGRLVSAYRDKFLGLSGKRPIRERITAKYRNMSVVNSATGFPTFTEFIRYILDEFRAGNELNRHWTPMYRLCNPCKLNLTHIIKFETFDRDTRALLQKANLGHLVPANRRLPTRNQSSRSTNSTLSLLDSYLKQLTPELLDGIRKLFEIDFDLFEYDKRENFEFL